MDSGKMIAMRLDQFLVKSDIGSRSEVKKLVKAGRVCVGDAVVRDPSVHIDENTDTVTLDGAAVVYEKFRYYMLNKPAGYVSATQDGQCATVIDLLDGVSKKDLFPVGRLDKDTEGLLLITNDGKLSHELLSPSHHVDKKYYVCTDRMIGAEEKKAFEKGLDIGDDKPTLPAKIEETDNGYIVTIREGRFHQIKRMFSALGAEVTFLKRLSMGGLVLDESLLPGQFRPLTTDEIKNLF